MEVKSQEVTTLDHRLTSSRRREKARIAKIGGTNMGRATRASKSSLQLGSQTKPSSKSLAMSPLKLNLTAAGLKRRPKRTVLPQPSLRACAVFAGVSPGLSIARTRSGCGFT